MCIDQVIYKIKEGKSINKIVKETGIPKSTVYYHFRKIKGRTIKRVKFNLSEENLGEFLGIFAGDGNFYLRKPSFHYRVSIFLGKNEKEYADRLINLFTSCFSKKPHIYARLSCIILCYDSKPIYNLLKDYLV